MLPLAQRKLPALLRRLLPMREFEKPTHGACYGSDAEPMKVPAKVYGVMAVTTVLTFATLMTGYQLLFPPQSLFA